MCKSLSEENFHFRTEALYLLGPAQPKHVGQNTFWTSWQHIRVQNPSNNQNFTQQLHHVLIKLFCSAEPVSSSQITITQQQQHTHCHAPHVPPLHPSRDCNQVSDNNASHISWTAAAVSWSMLLPPCKYKDTGATRHRILSLCHKHCFSRWSIPGLLLLLQVCSAATFPLSLWLRNGTVWHIK